VGCAGSFATLKNGFKGRNTFGQVFNLKKGYAKVMLIALTSATRSSGIYCLGI